MMDRQLTFGLLAVLLMASVATANLLKNGDFEDGYLVQIPYWSADSHNISIESWAACNETNGLTMQGWTAGGVIYQDIAVAGASNYSFEVYGYRDDTFSKNYEVIIALDFLDASEKVLESEEKEMAGSSAWEHCRVTATSPEDTEKVRVRLEFGGTEGKEGAYKWDDAELTSRKVRK